MPHFGEQLGTSTRLGFAGIGTPGGGRLKPSALSRTGCPRRASTTRWPTPCASASNSTSRDSASRPNPRRGADARAPSAATPTTRSAGAPSGSGAWLWAALRASLRQPKFKTSVFANKNLPGALPFQNQFCTFVKSNPIQ